MILNSINGKFVKYLILLLYIFLLLMKIIICIMSSESTEYNLFKQEWIKNINYIKNKTDIYDFYFVYGGRINNIIHHKNYTDIFYNITETINNMLRKTLLFFEYITQIEYTYLVRTNLSTLFDFEKMIHWFDNIYNTLFFGGSMIDGFMGKYTKFSGTNMVFSPDIINTLILHQDRFSYCYNEDIELSTFVLLYIKNCRYKTIKRLDILETDICFQKCKAFDEELFCYRFKSNNRTNDIYYYSLFFEYVILNKNCLNIMYISEYINGKIIKEIVENLSILSSKPFVINNDIPVFL